MVVQTAMCVRGWVFDWLTKRGSTACVLLSWVCSTVRLLPDAVLLRQEPCFCCFRRSTLVAGSHCMSCGGGGSLLAEGSLLGHALATSCCCCSCWDCAAGTVLPCCRLLPLEGWGWAAAGQGWKYPPGGCCGLLVACDDKHCTCCCGRVVGLRWLLRLLISPLSPCLLLLLDVLVVVFMVWWRCMWSCISKAQWQVLLLHCCCWCWCPPRISMPL